MDKDQEFLYKILIVVLVVAGVYYALSPIKGKISELGVEQINLESEIAIKDTYVNSQKVKDNIGFFFRVLPSVSNKEQINSLITSRARTSGVNILNFQFFEEEEDRSRTSVESSEQTEVSYFDADYRKLSFQVNVSGDLDQVLTYIRSFEEGEQYVTIDSMSYSEQPVAGGGGVLGRSTITMSTYYQGNGQ
jgi:hypothetical protein